MTPSLMLAVLVIVLAAATSVHSAVAVATDDATAAKILDLKKLDDLTKRLRGNDKRLIRVSPSATTIERQKELCTGRMISSLVKTIDQDGKSSNLQSTMDSMQPRFKAAEVLTNCCFEHSENRALAGTVTDDGNVFKGLQNLIRTSMEVFHASMKGKEEPSEKDQMLHYAIGMIIAQASELIWILSYNNEDNQRGFYEAAIVTELIESLKSLPVMFDNDGPFSHTNMWSLAALQNLAATYCHGGGSVDGADEGYCEWKWNDDSQDLVLPDGVKAKSTSSDNKPIDQIIRSEIMKRVKEEGEMSFGKLLVYYVCNGGVSAPHDDTYSWPSKATYPRSQSHPEIVPWAALGLFKNLVIDEDARLYFSEQDKDDNGHLFACTCNIYNYWPDEFELDKAKAVVDRMDWHDHCPTPYALGCKDLPKNAEEGVVWTERTTGKTCADFANERLCATHGDLVGTPGLHMAQEACCVCGGGIGGDEAIQGRGGSGSSQAFQSFQRVMESPGSGGGGGGGDSCSF